MAKRYLEQVIGKAISASGSAIGAVRTPIAGRLEKITIYSKNAVTTTNTFDVNKGTTLSGATTIFSNQANRPSLTTGNYSAENGGTLAVSLSVGDLLVLDADTIGESLDLLTVVYQIDDLTGVYDADAPAVSPNSVDDDFAGSALDSKWTQFGASDVTLTVGKGLCLIKQTSQGSYKLSGIYQTMPAGDWDLIAKVSIKSDNGANYAETGLCLLETDGATNKIQLFSLYSVSTSIRLLQSSLWTNRTTFGSTTQAPNKTFTPPDELPWSTAMLRIQKSGTNYRPFFSLDGIRWFPNGSAHALGFTPTKIGLCMYNQGTGSDVTLVCDWFRLFTTMPDVVGNER